MVSIFIFGSGYRSASHDAVWFE